MPNDRIDDGLQRRRDDTGAARAAGHQPRLAVLQDQVVGDIDDSGRLPGWMALASAANQAVGVGHAGFAEKSSISLLSRDAGAVGDDPYNTEGKIQPKNP